ncbi:MAG TPA: hypothetical protein VEI53_13795, partial [Ktedonobacteraceae bacterium]|nr:hypothetical protein [Ktedonobacteraceae bacterium]
TSPMLEIVGSSGAYIDSFLRWTAAFGGSGGSAFMCFGCLGKDSIAGTWSLSSQERVKALFRL